MKDVRVHDESDQAPDAARVVLQYAQQRLRALSGNRGIWALGDQAILSLGNFLTNIFLIRSLPRTEFGEFAVLLSVILFLNNLHASLVTYPLLITACEGDENQLRRRALGAVGITLMMAVPLGLILGLTSNHIGGLSLVPWVLAAMILWQVQETVRRALMARLEHHRAILGDVISFLGQAAVVWVVARFSTITIPRAFAIIAITSAVAAAIQAIQLRLHIHNGETPPLRLETQSREHWLLGRWVLLTNFVSLFTVYATPWVLFHFHGAAEVASFQAVANLLGVSNPVFTGMAGLIVPAVAKAKLEHGLHAARNAAIKYGLQGAALLTPYFGFLLIAPHFALRRLYGPDSPYLSFAGPLRMFVIIYAVFYVSQIFAGFLNGLGKSQWTFYGQALTAVVNTGVCLPMAAVYGLVGAIGSGVLPVAAQLAANLYSVRKAFSAKVPIETPFPSTEVVLQKLGERRSMTVTVLMPVYNGARFLPEAIESVLAQTHRDFEFVIADDGSTDNTLEIALGYQQRDSRIRVTTHLNTGIANNLNTAMQQIKNDWIVCMHGDDVMLPDRIERQLDFIANNPDIAVASTLVFRIDETGRTIDKSHSNFTTRDAVKDAMRRNEMIGFHHPAVIFRKSVVQEVGGYRQEFWPAEDADLWNRIVDRGHAVLVQGEYLLKYRIHGSSGSVSRAALMEQKVRFIEQCMADRRSGKAEPTWDQFLAQDAAASWPTRLNRRRRDTARTWYKAAVMHVCNRNYVRLIPSLLGAMVLDPMFVLPRLMQRFRKPPAADFGELSRAEPLGSVLARLPDGPSEPAPAGSRAAPPPGLLPGFLPPGVPPREKGTAVITVLMPLYNPGRFLEQALDSVLAQTFADFELLIIDDGSTDNTPATLNRYAAMDSRIRIVTRPNTGLAHSLNHGLDLAGTEWVAVMHGDDVMHPDRLEKQIKFVAQHRNLAVASSLVNFIDSDGRPLGLNRSHLTSRAVVRAAVARNECVAFNHPAVIYRREVIRKVGGYRQEFWPAEDIDLWNRVVDAGYEVLVQPQVLLNYRIHGNSASATRAAMVTRKLRWIEICIQQRHLKKPEPTWEQFESDRRKLPLPARFNEWRRDTGRTSYQVAQHLYAARRYGIMLPRLLTAVLLEPTLFIPRLFSRLVPPEPTVTPANGEPVPVRMKAEREKEALC
jgi:glycosyltransferase involved in cell wall biosynthesis/O-antigen/teichoic acid export membrane protein